MSVRVDEINVATVIGKRWLAYAVDRAYVPPRTTWGVSKAFDLNDPDHESRLWRRLCPADIDRWFATRAEAESHAAARAAAEVQVRWTCVVCGAKHELTDAGFYCGGCGAMSCCSCERAMAQHVCVP